MPYKFNPITGNFDYYEAGGFENLYWKGNYNSFVEGAGIQTTTSTYVPNYLFGFPIFIKSDVTLENIRIFITIAAAGEIVFGLYDSLDGKPNSKIFQSDSLNTGVLGLQSYTFPTPQKIKSGLYYVSYMSNSAPHTRILDPRYSTGGWIGEDDNSFTGVSTLFSRIQVYSSTMPSIWGTPTGFNRASSYPYIPYVQFKIG